MAVAFAILNNTGPARRLAVNAALGIPQRECMEAILRVFHQLDPEDQARSVARSDIFMSVLRTAVHDEDKLVRMNSCDYLISTDDTRTAYLLAELMQDSAPEIRKRAQDGILSLARNYHMLAAAAHRGKVSVPRHVLETKRYSLLDALLTALRFYKNHERPEIIAELLALDPRGDEILLDVVTSPADRRRRIVLDILETATFQRAISFILTMLKNNKAAPLAVEIIEVRFDEPFIRTLLSTADLFSNARVTTAFGQIRFIPWLRPGSEHVSALPERLAVRAVRFLLESGTDPGEKAAVLKALSASTNVALASASRFVLAAQARKIHPDQIDAGLIKIEGHCPELPEPPVEPEIDKLIVKKDAAEKPRGSAVFLSDEVLFRNFLNSFDAFARTEKDAALKEFADRGVFVREVRRILSGADPEMLLRSIKLIEHTGKQDIFAAELVTLTRHPDARVRSACVRQLGKSGTEEALKTLFQALNDRDRRVLANAVEALEGTGHRQILRLLEPLLEHPDNRVRGNAAKAAWSLGSDQGLACFVNMLKSPKANMRLTALWGLRQIGARDQNAAIRDLARNDPDDKVRKSAELTLAELENIQ
jgi:hypothetical protein